ncbi:FAD binding domain [Cordyceps militaris]|uniref:FAD binding domain n=1 Tax=Cordyceps militaris TaxID=73501 RepID=A0A2H4S9E1_CORMI|nr:FAD binding domain [Cordyceps militaris]
MKLSTVVVLAGLASRAAARSHGRGICLHLNKAASWPGLILLLSAVAALAAYVSSNVAVRPRIEGACVRSDAALRWLASQLSENAAISCRGQPLQQHNADRYWGEQFGKNASVVVYPATTHDVSRAVQAAAWSTFGRDFSVVGGAHSQVNASSSYGFVLDMSWMNISQLILNFTDTATTGAPFAAVEYQGGANWGQVHAVTNGTGYAAVGARVANVGVGGFSLGGGIGFLAGAYGFATDRLVQLEVVLPSGEVVTATKTNEHADLFWALQGGSGQFGIVTRFWQRAVAEPKRSTLAFYYVEDEYVARLRQQTVEFFDTNKDPFSVVYYSFGYLPNDLGNATPESYAKRTLLITVHFDDPTNPGQLNNTATFERLLDGIDTSRGTVVPTAHYADLAFIGEAAYPYGYRRGFYGGQTSAIDVDYLARQTDTFWRYIDALTERGEHPYSASFVVQYMHPGLSGHLPASDADTAWPHAVVGHQTLFTAAYKHAENDALTLAAVQALNEGTYAQQRKVGGGRVLANYPNYIAPGDGGCRVWGRNVKRLVQVKQKYDPGCLLRNGKVFASQGCVEGGWANVFDDCE